MKPTTITYLFRSPGTGHSIEGLFNNLRPEIERQSNVATNVVQLPHVSRGIRSVWRNLRFVATLKSDIFHITGDVHYVALALPTAKTVLTIHDCITLKTNRNRPLRYVFFWLFWYYLPIRSARIITVVSEKTRQELIRYVGSVAQKVVVIPNAYDPAFIAHPQPITNNQPMLLQIGTAPHKNLLRLADALENIACTLLIVGPLRPEQIERLRQRQIHYRHYVDLRRAEIVRLYQECLLVTFISTYEGFGMPILEANASGRAILTSNLSPMRDVARNAAHLVDPTDVAAIREGILRLLNDTTYRQARIDAGLRNAQEYTVRAIAKRYVALYQPLQPTD